MDNCRHPSAGIQNIDAVLPELRLHRALIRLTPYQIVQKKLPQDRQIPQITFPQGINIPALFDLLLQILPHPGENLRQFLHIHRFQNIFRPITIYMYHLTTRFQVSSCREESAVLPGFTVTYMTLVGKMGRVTWHCRMRHSGKPKELYP